MLDLTIILPVHNEVNSISDIIKEWKNEIDRFNISYEFIVSEDGSNDGTKDLLNELVNIYPITLCQENIRRGYGKAVIDGINLAKSKYILCIDSDGQCNHNNFERFWINRDSYDVLIGWRTNRQDTFIRKVYSGLFKRFFNLLFDNHLHDPSAPFVLFKKQQILKHIRYLLFLQEGFWWGFIGTCIKNKLSIREIPIDHMHRTSGGTRVFILRKIPNIASRNIWGLIKLKLST
jgi:glycosyltransferase involved in cell wall biosynthesis